MGRWRDSKRVDRQRAVENRRSSAAKYFGMRLEVGSQPIRLHFVRPEKMYLDIYSDVGVEFPWKKGQRYWVPKPINRYIEKHPTQDLIEAYSNPAQYGFNVKASKKMAALRPKGYNAMAGNIEEWHHLVEFQRKDGDGTYMSREICTGRGCEWCKSGWSKVFGKRFHTVFNGHQWRTVIEPLLEKLDRYCKCGGYIYPSHYECPECHGVLVDLMQSCYQCGPDAELTINEESHQAECLKCHATWSLLECEDENLSAAVSEEVTCPHCSGRVYPDPVMICTDPNGSGCQGDPYDIYDARITLRKAKGDNDKQYNFVIEKWEIADHDPKLFDPANQKAKTSNKDDDEISEKVAESFKTSLPLDIIYAPTPPHEVAQLFNVANLFSGAVAVARDDSVEEEADVDERSEPESEGRVVTAQGQRYAVRTRVPRK